MYSLSCSTLQVDRYNIEFHFCFHALPILDDNVMIDNHISETDNFFLFNIINSFRYKYAFYSYNMNVDRVNRITDYKGVWKLLGFSDRSGFASFYDLIDKRVYWGIKEEKNHLIFSRFSQLALCSTEKMDVLEFGSMFSGQELLSTNAEGLLNIIKAKQKGLCSISVSIPSEDCSHFNLRISLDAEGRNVVDHVYKDLANNG